MMIFRFALCAGLFLAATSQATEVRAPLPRPCIKSEPVEQGILPTQMCFSIFEFVQGGEGGPAIVAQVGRPGIPSSEQVFRLNRVGNFSNGDRNWSRFEGPLLARDGQSCSVFLETRVTFELDTDWEGVPLLDRGALFEVSFRAKRDSCHSEEEAGNQDYRVSAILPKE